MIRRHKTGVLTRHLESWTQIALTDSKAVAIAALANFNPWEEKHWEANQDELITSIKRGKLRIHEQLIGQHFGRVHVSLGKKSRTGVCFRRVNGKWNMLASVFNWSSTDVIGKTEAESTEIRRFNREMTEWQAEILVADPVIREFVKKQERAATKQPKRRRDRNSRDVRQGRAMKELAKILSPSLTEELARRASPTTGRVFKPATVARRQEELAHDAWSQREHVVREVAEWGVFALHDGKAVHEVRTIYRKAAGAYYELLQAIDFKLPVEHLLSVSGRRHSAAEIAEAHEVEFIRFKRGRYGQRYGVYLANLTPYDYEAECALTCAMIAQDWPLAESLAREFPIRLSAKIREAMSLSLLRYTVLGRKKQVEERTKLYSDRASGIDFPPRRADFALAIARRDDDLLAKALKGTVQTFREKWRMSKYVTPSRLRRSKSRAEAIKECAVRLSGLRWGYSTWGVAMMCLASQVGMQIPTDPRKFSDFVPYELCVPED